MILHPRGHLSMYGDIFGYHNEERCGNATGISWVEDRDAAKCPIIPGTTSTTKKYQAQNVIVVRLRNPAIESQDAKNMVLRASRVREGESSCWKHHSTTFHDCRDMAETDGNVGCLPCQQTTLAMALIFVKSRQAVLWSFKFNVLFTRRVNGKKTGPQQSGLGTGLWQGLKTLKTCRLDLPCSLYLGGMAWGQKKVPNTF